MTKTSHGAFCRSLRGLVQRLAEDHLRIPATAKPDIPQSVAADIFRSAQTREALPGHLARVELYPLSHSERHDHRCNQIDRLLGDAFDDALPQPLDRITLG